jgi:hypothetical protein
MAAAPTAGAVAGLGVYTGAMTIHKKPTAKIVKKDTLLAVTGSNASGRVVGALDITGLGNFNFSGTLIGKTLDLQLTGTGSTSGTLTGKVTSKGAAVSGHVKENLGKKMTIGAVRLKLDRALTDALIQSGDLQSVGSTNTGSGAPTAGGTSTAPGGGGGVLGTGGGSVFGGGGGGVFG